LQGLLIFGLRIIDMSLSTLRLMMMTRGYKLLTATFGFFGSAVFVIAIRPVIQDLDDWRKLIGYAAGFSTGMLLGLYLEERLGMGFTLFRIVSSRRGVELAARLRTAGYAVTEIAAWGKDGNVALLHCIVQRRRLEELIALVNLVDPEAFIAAQDVRSLQRGYQPD
jgi:uncharacterized protein YebE (UPF0316 family)